ncbi:hypothetical protein Taro_009617, partial [Colocasia esculenta]|nr:hypothetical protein [Colocasia esculenta]
MRPGSLSRSDRDRYLCRDGPENMAYRAVAFSVSSLVEWVYQEVVRDVSHPMRAVLPGVILQGLQLTDEEDRSYGRADVQ